MTACCQGNNIIAVDLPNKLHEHAAHTKCVCMPLCHSLQQVSVWAFEKLADKKWGVIGENISAIALIETLEEPPNTQQQICSAFSVMP
jgi:hypothetical protein